MMAPPRTMRDSGFTLIEILVALSVVAITLAAGIQASGALMRGTERQGEVWLAQICAENELARLRLLRQLPPIGESSVDCEQGGQRFNVNLVVQPTPNPNFRRIDAQVSATSGDRRRMVSVATVQGRY
jgi:general secretion pathway protein I